MLQVPKSSRIFLTFFALWLTGLAACARYSPRFEFQGEVKRTKNADTTTVEYHLIPKNGTLISAQLQYCPNYTSESESADSIPLPPYCLFGNGGDNPFDSTSQQIDSMGGKVSLIGRLNFFRVHSTTRDRYRLTYQYKPLIREKTTKAAPSIASLAADSVYHDAKFNNLDYSLEAPRELELGLCGASNSGFQDLADKKSAVVGYHYRVAGGIMVRDFSFMMSTQGTQVFRRYTFFEYAGLSGQWMILGRTGISPFITLGGKYSRVKGQDSASQIVHKGLGWELGAGIQSDFERLSYSYSTNLSGYHKFDLLLAALSFPFGSKIGTGFTLYSGKYVRQFQLNMVVSMATESAELERTDRRPKLLRVLSSASIIYLSVLFLIGEGK